jgi:hypothetical protein
LISFPDPPRSEREFPSYGARLTQSIAGYIKIEAESKWQQARVELSRQLALAIGMVLIALSFLIQMTLQFFVSS